MMFFGPGGPCSASKESVQAIRSFDLPAGGINGADRDVMWALPRQI